MVQGMSTIALPQARRRRAIARPALSALTARPELLVLLVVAAALNLWALDLNGYANDYYSAAVRSMTTSWHAFLYGAFDAAGLQTVDKPPLALWVQALSARAFGFSSWSLLVPQALMGVATVGLVYDMALRRFGRAGGVRGRADARADADHGRDLAPQQPGRAARALHHRGRLGRPTVACASRAARAGCLLSGAFVGLGFRDEDGRGAARRARASSPRGSGSLRRPAARAARSCSPAARDGRGRARVAAADVADAGVEPAVHQRAPTTTRSGR